ncbi:MAG: hypothetical protein A3H64_00215 [Candidatus Ryanbacteria bacterium RIFCSPLOWO2_02_FULL_45_11c]|uniref:Uncharacterized protein n=1 Tax=Candidatus Ryanbacteria bacterium RIFCSPLOWO2_02_FULL_45_11c TaxID=1802128 RepID=A0A1G2GYD8_9BACT|nr:MAG: hypothetical protein A3H64_00215 [Candidatus Ryanbacteria bacterium RIFCSPLOWO2_02_FULL_45_11c]
MWLIDELVHVEKRCVPLSQNTFRTPGHVLAMLKSCFQLAALLSLGVKEKSMACAVPLQGGGWVPP